MTDREIKALGDSAIVLTLGTGISESLSESVVAESQSIRAGEINGVLDIVPSYASVTVHYDPLRIGYADLRSRLLALTPRQDNTAERESRLHEITVRYDGEDLEDVARRTGMSAADVIELHSRSTYRVFVIGFVPGFAYLGTLDPRLVLPRREAPRKRVPAGSVAIAESQTGIYPTETPGGWHLIGNTGISLFDASQDKPSLFSVGDRVRFVPA